MLPGWRSLGDELMERENQGTEVSETPAASTVLCITLGYVAPGCRGERGARHPALGAPDSTYTLGCIL